MSNSFKIEISNHSKNIEHGIPARGADIRQSSTLCEVTLCLCPRQLSPEGAVLIVKLVLVC